VTSTFRLVALLVSAVALFTGQVHAQGAVEQATFDLPAVRDPQLGAQIAIADQFGYFKDEGLEVEIVEGELRSYERAHNAVRGVEVVNGS